MNVKTTTDRILTRLEDPNAEVWSRSEIADHIQDGLAQLCKQTECLWDMAYAENTPPTGNYTAPWELEYFEAGDPVFGQINYVGEWEQEYVDNGVGPVIATSSADWPYITSPTISPTSRLPSTLIKVDRVTHDGLKIEPRSPAEAAAGDARFQTTTGPVGAYSLTDDGLLTLRKIPVPDTACDYVAVTGTWGILRSASDSEFGTTPTITGSFGSLRNSSGHFPIGQWGMPRRMYLESDNTRVEFFRWGSDIPDYCVKYVELYVMGKARNRDGPGQEIRLAKHFMQRFELGINRLKKRVQAVLDARTSRFGASTGIGDDLAFPRMPWHYPRIWR